MGVLTRGQPLKVLLELRPALDKHAGIPQQTRLLFRGLSLFDGLSVEGLIQSSTHALRQGLPSKRTFGRSLPAHRKVDRLSRVVIMLEQRFIRSRFSIVSVLLRRLIGAPENLSAFDATYFKDFVWRKLFARSLPPSDFNTVTEARFRIAKSPWTAMHICRAVSKFVGLPVFPRLDTRDFAVMIAETPYPGNVSAGTRLVVHYHDAIPLLMPHTIADRQHHQAFHYHALHQNVKSGAWFVCVSEATRRDLLSMFPEVESRSVVIHNIVSHDYFDEESSASRVRDIVGMRLNGKAYGTISGSIRSTISRDWVSDSPEYLLMVSTIEPRKNHLGLLTAWERLRAERFPHLKLLLVGQLGWQHRVIVSKMRPWLERGEMFCLADVPGRELRLLYKHARATVCPSFAEGFDLSGVEAMASGGVVAASDLPVHREVFADAAEYFNPYSVTSLAQALAKVLDPAHGEFRHAMVCRGAIVSRLYTFDEIMPKWKDLFMRCVTDRKQDRAAQLIEKH